MVIKFELNLGQMVNYVSLGTKVKRVEAVENKCYRLIVWGP